MCMPQNDENSWYRLCEPKNGILWSEINYDTKPKFMRFVYN